MKRLFLLMMCVALLNACCCGPCGKLVVAPPPISMEEQVRRLTEWQHALPRVRADLQLAGAHLEYPDEKGAMQSRNSEGYLLLQQHFDAAAGSAESRGDVYLVGKVLQTTKVFEAGRNAEAWWFAIFVDQNTARTGDASRPVNVAALSDPKSSGILRADLVFDMLGLSELSAPAANAPAMPVSAQVNSAEPQPLLLMLANDADASNHLYLAQDKVDLRRMGNPSGPRFGTIAREIIVDRVSGHVTEVHIYNSEGVLVVRSELSEYKPVEFEEGVERPAVVPQFPHRVRVSYPAQKTIITLHFEKVTVPDHFGMLAFAKANFDSIYLFLV
jgi:hypothetical protein